MNLKYRLERIGEGTSSEPYTELSKYGFRMRFDSENRGVRLDGTSVFNVG